MRPCLAVLTVLLVNPVLAQTASLAHPAVVVAPRDTNCPVSFTAQRWGSSTGLMQMGEATQRGSAHGIYLRSAPALLPRVKVIVRGSSSGLHLEPAGEYGRNDLHQALELSGLPRDANGNWKIVADRVPFIHEIEITEIQFADGHLWHASQESQCRLQPDGFLLVAGSR